MPDFFALPYWLLMALLVAFAVGVACGLHTLVRRTVPYEKLVEHNDVAGFMIAIVGVLYAVLISFVVVVVWQQYNESDSNYGSEISAVADVYAFAVSLAPAKAREVQHLADRYVSEMIAEEWPLMRSGRASEGASATLAQMLRSIDAIVPHTFLENDTRTHLHVAEQRIFDLRNRRLSDNAQTLPPVLWVALIVGAFITICFGFLFGVENFRIQLVMTGAVAALVALMFTLLIELDFPFRRDTAISPARWVELEGQLRSMRVAVRPAARDVARAGRP